MRWLPLFLMLPLVTACGGAIDHEADKQLDAGVDEQLDAGVDDAHVPYSICGAGRALCYVHGGGTGTSGLRCVDAGTPCPK